MLKVLTLLYFKICGFKALIVFICVIKILQKPFPRGFKALNRLGLSVLESIYMRTLEDDSLKEMLMPPKKQEFQLIKRSLMLC